MERSRTLHLLAQVEEEAPGVCVCVVCAISCCIYRHKREESDSPCVRELERAYGLTLRVSTLSVSLFLLTQVE